MNKKNLAFAIIIISLFSFLAYGISKGNAISDKLIRFHVIANSDSSEDQDLKLKVRDSILKEIGPKLEISNSKEESEDIIRSNFDIIKTSAEKEIINYGKNYEVTVVLGKSPFPTKMYSTIALPAGEYDALKVIIGEGEGKNWWCVMFPPLCFIDITKGVTSNDTEERLKNVLDTAEYNSILNNDPKDKINEAVKKPIESDSMDAFKDMPKDQQKVEFRLKSVEVVKSVYKKIEDIVGVK